MLYTGDPTEERVPCPHGGFVYTIVYIWMQAACICLHPCTHREGLTHRVNSCGLKHLDISKWIRFKM